MTDEALQVLSAGAAKAVVTALAGTFRQRPGDGVAATFDAAGAVRARLVAGDPCDVVILPKPMLQALADDGHVARESIASLGRVSTGIAIPHGAPLPAVGNAAALRTTLERASALYCPDRERATAGIHFERMLRELGIHDRVASRIRAHPNGAAAMAAMAAAGDPEAVGCTQASEILYTPGVTLVGPLPEPFALVTDYGTAVAAKSNRVQAARKFCALLVGSQTRALREQSGFLAE
jgi:molybdate transport system substrate-binding protein